MQRNCVSAVITSAYLTMDETLYPMRNWINIKVYNKSKPSKYGLLLQSLNSVEYPYTNHSHVYTVTTAGPLPITVLLDALKELTPRQFGRRISRKNSSYKFCTKVAKNNIL